MVEFNQAFAHIQREVKVVKPLLTGNKATYPSVEEMVRMGERLYLELASTDMWTGVSTKANQSGFVANNEGKKITSCWNCGREGHALSDCKKPKNNELIEKRRNAYREARKKSNDQGKNKGSSGKSGDKKK